MTKHFNIIIVFTICLFIGSACSSPDKNLKKSEIKIASWNVENLFDTIDDEAKKDEEFTPEGKKQWTEKRLAEKIDNLSKVIKFIDADLMGFQEVEHESLLKMLLEDLSLSDNYSIVYAESPDGRGIDNGLIYNSSIFNLLEMDTIKVELSSGYPTRYILYSSFVIFDIDTLHIFVNHWPSRSGGQEKSEPHRINAANRLRDYINILQKKFDSPKILIMGDFNDEPNNLSLTDGLKTTGNIDSINNSFLYNSSYNEFIEGAGSYLYRGDWNMLDQIILSNSLVVGNKLRYVKNSFEVVKSEIMITPEGKYKGSPMRSFGGGKYLGGYSDHFPVVARFIIATE